MNIFTQYNFDKTFSCIAFQWLLNYWIEFPYPSDNSCLCVYFIDPCRQKLIGWMRIFSIVYLVCNIQNVNIFAQPSQRENQCQ